MGYDLRAVIGGTQILRRAVADLGAARLTDLGHGLSLVPMTDELFDSVTDGNSADPLGFCFLPEGFADVLARWSRAGDIAYAEAEYWEGVGTQRAAVWSRGSVVLGPLVLEEHESPSEQGTPISMALHSLGIRLNAEVDEFEAAGLRRHRHTEDWAGDSPSAVCE